MAVLLHIHPAIVFAIAMAGSVVIFFAVRFLLHIFYVRISDRWPLFNRIVEKARTKGAPLVKKYGFLGLALFIAIPLPTTGVYGGALLSWLLGMNWRHSLAAVMLGATVSNGLVALSVMGISQVVTLPG